jgi:hypothetical protein
MATFGLSGISGLGSSYQSLSSTLIGSTAVRQASGYTQGSTASGQVATGTGIQSGQAQTTQTQATQTLATAAGTGSTGTVLSAQQKAQIAQFKLLDQTARADVDAQERAAGAYGGTVDYQYERGPDGTLYAVAGDVSLNVQPVPNNPAATLAAMQTITNAALSVVPPTAQDLLAVREAAQYTATAEAALHATQAGTATNTNAGTTTGATAQTAQSRIARQQAVTATTTTLLAAQQQAVGALYGVTGRGFSAYAATTLGTPANQAGSPLAQAI